MVYLDHAASTPLRPEAVAAMAPFAAEDFANPSGMHAAARSAKSALEVARERIAAVCGAAPGEIVFTGGGSEADNLAVKGAARAARARTGADGIVSTAIEHKAVLASCDRLRPAGFRVGPGGADGSATDSAWHASARTRAERSISTCSPMRSMTGPRWSR